MKLVLDALLMGSPMWLTLMGAAAWTTMERGRWRLLPLNLRPDSLKMLVGFIRLPRPPVIRVAGQLLPKDRRQQPRSRP